MRFQISMEIFGVQSKFEKHNVEEAQTLKKISNSVLSWKANYDLLSETQL